VEENGFARIDGAENVWREVGGGEGGGEGERRGVAFFVSEAEAAPVHSDAEASAEIAVDLDGFGGIAVLGAHEPAREVGADGEDCGVWGTEASGDFAEQGWVVAGVAGEVESVSRY
jgi:hypothetical protein